MANRFLPLDGLRAVAVGLVLIAHYSQEMPIAGPVDRWFFALARSGWIGVDLFFVLSGFLITGILVDGDSSPRFLGAFYTRRALRIFPIYYFLLAVLFWILPALGAPVVSTLAADNEVWFWLYGSNYLTGLYEWPGRAVGHLWSLAVEEHFYLVWPWIVLACPRRLLLRVTMSLLLAVVLLRWATSATGSSPTASYVMTHLRADSLFSGALLAIAWRDAPARALLERHYKKALALLVVGIGLWLATAKGLEWQRWSALQLAGGFLLIALLFVGIHVACLSSSPRSALYRALTLTPMPLVGRLSYGIYLFHRPLELVAVNLGWHPSAQAPGPLGSLPYVVTYIVANSALTLGAAWCIWHLFEKHALRLKDRFRYRLRVDTPGVGTTS